MDQSGKKRGFSHVLRRTLRVVLLALVVVVLLPYLITPLYAIVDPVSTTMLSRRLSGLRVERQFLPIVRVSPALPLVVIIAEDGRFCSHHGIDLTEIREAIADADDIDEMRGGSTITQQVAKNLFLWQGRSYVRKVLEFPLALWIDLVLSKRRILEIYLNIAEWDPTASLAPRPAPGARSGNRPKAYPPMRRRYWPPSCPIPLSAMRGSPGRACAVSQGFIGPARRARRQRLRACGEATSLVASLHL